MDTAKKLNMFFLQTFFMDVYETERDFYGQFEGRIAVFEDFIQNLPK